MQAVAANALDSCQGGLLSSRWESAASERTIISAGAPQLSDQLKLKCNAAANDSRLN